MDQPSKKADKFVMGIQEQGATVREDADVDGTTGDKEGGKAKPLLGGSWPGKGSAKGKKRAGGGCGQRRGGLSSPG